MSRSPSRRCRPWLVSDLPVFTSNTLALVQPSTDSLYLSSFWHRRWLSVITCVAFISALVSIEPQQQPRHCSQTPASQFEPFSLQKKFEVPVGQATKDLARKLARLEGPDRSRSGACPTGAHSVLAAKQLAASSADLPHGESVVGKTVQLCAPAIGNSRRCVTGQKRAKDAGHRRGRFDERKDSFGFEARLKPLPCALELFHLY